MAKQDDALAALAAAVEGLAKSQQTIAAAVESLASGQKELARGQQALAGQMGGFAKLSEKVGAMTGAIERIQNTGERLAAMRRERADATLKTMERLAKERGRQ